MRITRLFVGMTAVLGLSASLQAAVVGDSLGFSGPLPVYKSWDGNQNSLQNRLNSLGATDGSGGSLVVEGASSDQVRFQRFAVNPFDAVFSFTFLGGVAAYQNVFGIYTYDISQPSTPTASLDMTEVFTRHVDPLGTTVDVNVDAGHYVGFYLVADGGRSPKGTFYSETSRNSGLDATKHHFLLLDSIVSGAAGYTIAVEDLPYNSGTGLMGDSDYNDLFVQMTYRQVIPLPDPQGNPAVPEPATMGLAALALGSLSMSVLRRRR